MSILDKERISEIDTAYSLHDLQYVSFDVETTGLSPVVSRLVELSGVKFRLGGEIVSTFSSLINPEIPIPQEVSAIHGITDDMVSDAPTMSAVIPDFVHWISDDNTVLVAHNAPFDVEFLQVALSKLRLAKPTHPVVDTLTLSRRLLTEVPNHQLKTLVQQLGLETGDFHRALADSYHVRNLLRRMVFRDPPLSTWGDICEHGCVASFEADLYASQPPEHMVEMIENIRLAIDAGTSLTFVYDGFRKFRRTVDPLALIQSRGNYYLSAICRRAADERTFRLDKMSQLQSGVGAKANAS